MPLLHPVCLLEHKTIVSSAQWTLGYVGPWRFHQSDSSQWGDLLVAFEGADKKGTALVTALWHNWSTNTSFGWCYPWIWTQLMKNYQQVFGLHFWPDGPSSVLEAVAPPLLLFCSLAGSHRHSYHRQWFTKAVLMKVGAGTVFVYITVQHSVHVQQERSRQFLIAPCIFSKSFAGYISHIQNLHQRRS